MQKNAVQQSVNNHIKLVEVAKQEQQDQEKIIEQVRLLDNQIAMLKDKQVAGSKMVNIA